MSDRGNKSIDPLDEIRKARDEHAKAFDYDIDAIVADLRRRAREEGDRDGISVCAADTSRNGLVMPRKRQRKILDKDLDYAWALLRRVIPSLLKNIDVVAEKGNGSAAYEQCQLAIRELLEVQALTESTYADGHAGGEGNSPC